MSLKNIIIANLAHVIAKHIGKVRVICNQASSEVFRKKVKCKGEVHVNSPVFVKGGQYVTVGDSFFSNSGLRIECVDEYYGQRYSPKLVIGDHVSFGCRCHIGCVNRIEIGNHVLLGSNVLIIDHSHGRFEIDSKDVPWERQALYSKGPIVIEDNVWLGDNVSVLPGVTIGKGSVVGQVV